MERGLYTAATGMSVAEMTMDVISNNLANTGTTGFKRDALIFNEALERVLKANGGSGREVGPLGNGPGAKGLYTVFEMGNLQATGNPMDLAIGTKEGMFAVQTPQGVKYTRDGVFALDLEGFMVDGNGYRVLDDGGADIQLDPGKLEISETGLITVNGNEVARIGLYQGTFDKDGFGLFESPDAVALDEEQVKVQQGFVEASNVNAIEEMILMIKLNRAFEMAQKSASSQDESTQRLLQALQS